MPGTPKEPDNLRCPLCSWPYFTKAERRASNGNVLFLHENLYLCTRCLSLYSVDFSTSPPTFSTVKHPAPTHHY